MADGNETLRREAERIQASGALGDAKLRRLFDYLVASSLAGQSPKEITIAIDVFNKNAEFDKSQDASVRVYIHKLRRALADFYDGPAGEYEAVLEIPRGEYRLALVPKPPVAATTKPRVRAGAVAVLGAGALGVAVMIALGLAWLRALHSDLERVRSNPIWSALLKDDRPIMVVVGDYYLIGETDKSLDVKRLIREYTVNSKSDLDNYVKQHPEVADRYMDVGLRYLPTATAFALRDVMPILTAGNRHVLVRMMSDLKPDTLKSVNIVYIGYLSGLGIMQELVFSRSRFKVGETYDELIDKKTKHSYVSQSPSESEAVLRRAGNESSYRDYGFFSSFRGPGGNTIIVISGTRDEGVQQTAESFTDPEKLEEFSRQGDTTVPFEALLEVRALDGVNVNGKLLLESRREEPKAEAQ
jgi:hypothetical protein